MRRPWALGEVSLGLPQLGDDLLRRVASPVASGILHLFADLLRALALPEHRQRRESPIRDAGHEAICRVRRLVARLALLSRRAVGIGPDGS